MSGSVSLDGDTLHQAFLRIDTDVRFSMFCAIRDRLKSRLVEIDDDQNTHLIIAHFAEHIADWDDLVDALSDYFTTVIERRVRVSPVAARLVEAREMYERFFDANPGWNIPGWSNELITLATDLYSRSSIEIAATVWHYDRANAASHFPTSMLKAPQVEFDHRMLGSGRYVLISDHLSINEPFFETEYPVTGVFGVNRAWMYLAAEVVDQFGAEIASFMMTEMPEAAAFLTDVDEPIENRPLGVDSTELAAEAFVRHLTITEAAESIFNRLAKKVDRFDLSSASIPDSELLTAYIREVLETGALCRPASFDSASARGSAHNLSRRLRESFSRRENVFTAWIRYVDYAKTCGVWVREYGRECDEIRSLLKVKYPETLFDVDLLRMTISALVQNQNLSMTDIVKRLIAEQSSSQISSRNQPKKVIRVFGENSPAIVI